MLREDALRLACELADAGFACQVTIRPSHVIDVTRRVGEHCSVSVAGGRFTLDELVELQRIGTRFMVDADLHGDLAYVPAAARADSGVAA